MADERFLSLDKSSMLYEGYTTIPNFMFRHYADAGVTRAEFLVILHLASYHYESANGQSSPSLETVAREMGYKDSKCLRLHIQSLEAKGVLTRILRPGQTSIYLLEGFSRKILAFHEQSQAQVIHNPPNELPDHPPNRFPDPLPIDYHQRTKQQENKKQSGVGTVHQEIADHLISLGVTRSQAAKWARVGPAEMVTGWIEYARRNGQGIHNVPGFLVSKLKTGEEPPKSDRRTHDGHRYIEGRYAHLIEH